MDLMLFKIKVSHSHCYFENPFEIDISATQTCLATRKLAAHSILSTAPDKAIRATLEEACSGRAISKTESLCLASRVEGKSGDL
jgi:hypothetical protein